MFMYPQFALVQLPALLHTRHAEPPRLWLARQSTLRLTLSRDTGLKGRHLLCCIPVRLGDEAGLALYRLELDISLTHLHMCTCTGHVLCTSSTQHALASISSVAAMLLFKANQKLAMMCLDQLHIEHRYVSTAHAEADCLLQQASIYEPMTVCGRVQLDVSAGKHAAIQQFMQS